MPERQSTRRLSSPRRADPDKLRGKLFAWDASAPGPRALQLPGMPFRYVHLFDVEGDLRAFYERAGVHVDAIHIFGDVMLEELERLSKADPAHPIALVTERVHLPNGRTQFVQVNFGEVPS